MGYTLVWSSCDKSRLLHKDTTLIAFNFFPCVLVDETLFFPFFLFFRDAILIKVIPKPSLHPL